MAWSALKPATASVASSELMNLSAAWQTLYHITI